MKIKYQFLLILLVFTLHVSCEKEDGIEPPIVNIDGELLTKQELTDYFNEISKLGNRPTGSPNHLYTIDWFQNKLEEFGASVDVTTYNQLCYFINEEEQNMQSRITDGSTPVWTANNSNKVKLEILDVNNQFIAEIPVAHYHQFSGKTDATGIIGELTTNINNTAGKIFINDYPNSLPDGPSWTDFTQSRRLTANDSDGFFDNPTNQPSPIQKSFSMHTRHQNINNQNAAGMITIFRDFPNDFIEGTLMPHIAVSERETPGVILSKTGGELLDIAISNGGVNARIVLEADFANTEIKTISTVVKGRNSDENIVLNAYIDGQASTGLPGALVMLGLTKNLLSIPKDSIARDVILVFTTHFSGSSSAADWAFKNISTLEKSVAYLGLETVGSESWTSTQNGDLEYNGKNAGCWCYVSDKGGAFLENTVENHIATNQVFPQISVNDNFVFSEATVFHAWPYSLPVVSCLGPSSIPYNGRSDIIDFYDMDILYKWQLAFDAILSEVLEAPKENLNP